MRLILLRLVEKNKIASLATTVIVHLFIGLVLYLIVISLGKNEIPQIVAVMETHDDAPQIERKDFAKKVKKKPQPAQSAARINPISATTVSSISVPAFEDPVVDPLGIGTDFGRGLALELVTVMEEETSTFFGGTAKGNRVVL